VTQAQTTTQSVSLAQAYTMAQTKHLSGDLDGARDVYERIARAKPDHVESLVMLASIAYRQGRDAEGRTSLAKAIDLSRAIVQRNGDDMRSRAALVNLLLAQERQGEAEALVAGLILPLNPMRANPEEFNARRDAGIARGLPTLIISTLPKSASESIWNKLTNGLGLAQCYISLGLFPECCLVPSRVKEAAKGGVAIKEHIGPSEHNIATLHNAGVDRLIVHHRDPRQAALSWAHFARDDVAKRIMGPLWRKIVPPAQVLAGDLPRLLDWCIDRYLPHQIEFLAKWRAVAAQPKPPLAVQFMSFESFIRDPDGYFARALAFYDIPKSAFAADAEAETVHLRKGETDEWRGVFTQAQRERAWALIPPDMAEAFGWEP
jgi:tetratricopeptide (TPR) repeat protein